MLTKFSCSCQFKENQRYLLNADMYERQTFYTQIKAAGKSQIGIQENIKYMHSMEMKRVLAERERSAFRREPQSLLETGDSPQSY